MLRLKVYVNEDQIDEIRILNTGEKNKNGYYKYKVILPKGFEDLIVWHDREKGWPELVERVLKKLRKEHFNPKKWQTDKSMKEIVGALIKLKEKDYE